MLTYHTSIYPALTEKSRLNRSYLSFNIIFIYNILTHKKLGSPKEVEAKCRKKLPFHIFIRTSLLHENSLIDMEMSLNIELIIIIIIIIIIIKVLQPLVGPWPSFQFLDPMHS
jgi:hypothetical protein